MNPPIFEKVQDAPHIHLWRETQWVDDLFRPRHTHMVHVCTICGITTRDNPPVRHDPRYPLIKPY